MYPCPSCGGSLRFDIASQMLKCEHCDSTFEPNAYEKSRVGKESPVYEAAVFICPTCGGEMITADESINGFCPYCGGQSFISKKGELEKPAYIIPFKVTKEDCKAAYGKMAFRSLFAPKELRDPEALEEFRGIYMPYWFVENSGHTALSTTGKRTYRRGDYRITDHYQISANVDYHICDTAYEASATYDDKISDAIAPYDGKDIRAFAPGYLTGFYADKADVPVSMFTDDAEAHCAALVNEAIKHSGVEADEIDDKAIKALSRGGAPGTDRKSWASLLPVWFLTWRDKDRVAYAVVNGQTGDVCADMPVDLRRYGFFCFLLALPIYLLLNLFFTPTPFAALRVTSFAAAIALIIYSMQLGAIRKRDMALGVEMEARSKGKKVKRKKESGCLTTMLIVFAIFVLPTVILMLADGDLGRFFGSGNALTVNGMVKSIWLDILVAVLALVSFARIVSRKNVLPGHNVVLPALGSLLSIAVCIVIFRWQPAEDMIYYGAVTLAYACMLFTLINVLRKYNYLATRPLPQTLRQGGDTSAPERGSGGSSAKTAAATGLAIFLILGTTLSGLSSWQMAPATASASTRQMAPATASASTRQMAPATASARQAVQVAASTRPMAFFAASTGAVSAASAPRALTATLGSFYSKSDDGKVYEGHAAEKDTNFRCIVDDQEELLSEYERISLLKVMQPITKYGNALFVTAYGDGSDAEAYSVQLYKERFGTKDGVIFLIDMGTRMLVVTSSGKLSKTITPAIGNAITDNIYRMARNKRYYACAEEAFIEIYTVLADGVISMPMKYISNAFLAVVLGTLLGYWILRINAARTFSKSGQVLTSVDRAVRLSDVVCMKTSTSRVYSPVSSSSGGGGGGRSGGGGGGGGGGGSFSSGSHGF